MAKISRVSVGHPSSSDNPRWMTDTIEHESFVSAVRYAVDNTEPHNERSYAACMRNMSRDPAWWGGTRQDILNAPHNGAPKETRGIVADFVATLMAESATGITVGGARNKRIRSRGDFGDELDIHAARAGRLDHAWTRHRRSHAVTGAKPLVHIYLRTGGLANVKTDNLVWCPAAAAAVAAVFDRLGARTACTLISLSTSVHNRKPSEVTRTTIPLTHFDERPDMNALALAAAPFVFRGIVIAGWHATFNKIMEPMTFRRDIPACWLTPYSQQETALVLPMCHSRHEAMEVALDAIETFTGRRGV